MLFGKKRSPKKYSKEWFETISDEELKNEREPIRVLAVMKGNNKAVELLHKFGEEEIKRMNREYLKKHPDSKPRHREHGWYLSNDD